MAASGVDLSVPPLEELQRRRSEKWSLFGPDVLSLTVAEMDFPVLREVRDAVAVTIERSDIGYGVPASQGLREALGAFAERRLHWRLDPYQLTVVPDVMLGIVELCRRIAGPNGAIGFATPAYPPFFREPTLRGPVHRSSWSDRRGLD